MPPDIGLTGGEKLTDRLSRIGDALSRQATLRVGFLEGATYPDGTSVPMVAAVQEFGATIKVDAHDSVIYRKTGRAGTLLRKGRFVKQAQSNFATTVQVPAHSITIPPRPYFRTMIKANSPQWPEQIATLLRNSNFNANGVLMRMGEVIKGQLQASIKALTSPPLAPSTIKKKGFAKPLISSSHLLQSVDYEVTE